MSQSVTRRSVLRASTFALASGVLPKASFAFGQPDSIHESIHLNLNENAFGPSSRVVPAITRQLPKLSRYADEKLARSFIEQIAAYEDISSDQILLGEILGGLGLYLGNQGGPGGEFVYSTPGYLALIDAAAQVGGVGMPVPLDANFENDLPALQAKVSTRTRAIYLINPHNPTGTVSDIKAFHSFLRNVSQRAPVIIDEAYLEYTEDFKARSAASLVREGANILVFRTFDKIHGLAGLPIGYTLAPKALVAALLKSGLGDAESLGRLNIIAAQAALSDAAHVQRVRGSVAHEREQWGTILTQLNLRHTAAHANFIFFDAGRPQPELAAKLREKGIEIGRAFTPYTNWARITIGLGQDNEKAQRALRQVLSA